MATKQTCSLPENTHTAFLMEMSEWPANSQAARQAKEEMQHTHIIQRLPATDVDARVIHPAEYDSFLRGCIAVVWFSVSKYAASNGDEFCARIEMMRTVALPDPRRRTLAGF
jgi:hypothetical protein